MLGLGSDIGGSLRGPAANCGIYSMKPTIGRHISYQDVVESAGPEPAGTQAIAGLMARYIYLSFTCSPALFLSVWPSASLPFHPYFFISLLSYYFYHPQLSSYLYLPLNL